MGCLDFLGMAAQAGGTVAAAQIKSNSDEKAAELQSQANANTLKFQREQAENDYKNQETTRRANYDQYVAKQAAMNRVRQGLGLHPVDIPAYVPSLDPFLNGAPVVQNAGGVTPPDLQRPDLGMMAGSGPASSDALRAPTAQQQAQQYLRTAAATPSGPGFIGAPGSLGQMAQGPGFLPIDPNVPRDAQGNPLKFPIQT